MPAFVSIAAIVEVVAAAPAVPFKAPARFPALAAAATTAAASSIVPRIASSNPYFLDAVSNTLCSYVSMEISR